MRDAEEGERGGGWGGGGGGNRRAAASASSGSVQVGFSAAELFTPLENGSVSL